jgi:YVTN family beta-propeller protein
MAWSVSIANADEKGAEGADIESGDRVFICNEDSNTMSVIDPRSNKVDTTINLTSFDEDPRPPFQFVTGGVVPTHAAMVGKPLYHGAIQLHGAAPSPDSRLLSATGRGSSNAYLLDTEKKQVIGNMSNPQAGPKTNAERVSSGILVGREPHEPTFTRNGKELWVTVRGENRIVILDAEAATRGGAPEKAIRLYIDTLNGPAQVWFSKDGKTAFVVSQKESAIDVLDVNPDDQGFSRPERTTYLNISWRTPYRRAISRATTRC